MTYKYFSNTPSLPFVRIFYVYFVLFLLLLLLVKVLQIFCYLSRIFRQHPEYKDFFKSLLDMNDKDKDAWLHPMFERHMFRVFLPTLGTIISNVDRPEVTRELMIRLGKVHRVKVDGINRQHVEVIPL